MLSEGNALEQDTARRIVGPGFTSHIAMCEESWRAVSQLNEQLRVYFRTGKRPVLGYSSNSI